jgi:GMP synthase-like glutamine amidotransferase
MRVLVLQHIACEPPGVYGDVMLEAGVELLTVAVDEGEALPPLNDVDAIVAMGGPMSVNDEERLPWLRGEKRLIADAVRAGVPFFGACLGVQLLAASLGACVYAGPAPEVGLMPVTLTDAAAEDPLFAGLPRELPTLQWHGDTFDLPPGAVLLASSPAFANQAFRYGPTAYGVQFHLEVSAELLAEWAKVPEYAAALARVLGPGAGPRLLEEFAPASERLGTLARTVFARWLDCASATRGGLDSAVAVR